MANARTFKSTLRRSVFRNATIAGLGALCATIGAAGLTSTPAAAQSILGSWSGGGTIVFASGESERARCRATFRTSGGGDVSMQGVCATASVRVSQSASLMRLTPTTYSGEFYNTEYNLSGSIRIRIQGNKLTASLSGGGGTAHFVMAK